jgi:hypothetical protein
MCTYFGSFSCTNAYKFKKLLGRKNPVPTDDLTGTLFSTDKMTHRNYLTFFFRTLWAKSYIKTLYFVHLKKYLLLYKYILKDLRMTVRQCTDKLNVVFSIIFTQFH